MIVSIEGLGLNITPEFMASQNSQTEQNNTGNAALADDIVDRINAAGYHARSVPSCSETTWLTAACSFIIKVDEFPDLTFSVDGTDWKTKTAENRAAFIISTGKVQTQGMYVPSTGSTTVSRPTATKTTTRPKPAAVARPSGVTMTVTPATTSTAAILTGDTTPQVKLPDVLQQIVPTGDVSSWLSENKWLLIGGAAVALFFMMGRGK